MNTTTTPATLNVTLLRATLAHIEAHPELHDEASWGERHGDLVTHSFGARAIVLAGYTPVMGPLVDGGTVENIRYWCEPITGAIARGGDGLPWDNEVLAAHVLGITYDATARRRLLQEARTAADFRSVVGQLCADAE